MRHILYAAVAVLLAGPATAQVDGTQYTVVTPILRGESNNYSFIRLGNIGQKETTISVTVVGSPSGESYGTAEYEVPPWASLQYSVNDILDEIGASGLGADDEGISLYLQSPDQGNLPVFQHVVWNSMTGFFENAGRCTFRKGVDYSQLNRALINVHTSRIANYPATVFLHNYADSEATYRGNVFDARDGAHLGAVNFNMMANETRAVDFSEIEEDIGFVPESDQYHANIIFHEIGADDFNLLALQGIRNLHLDAYTNISALCEVNYYDSTAPDLIVQPVTVNNRELDAGASFTLSATVGNVGDGAAASTTLRYYRSPNATISSTDTEVGTDIVSSLQLASISRESITLTAPSQPGTYYYGACVDSVDGESDTGNNCASGVRVTVSAKEEETVNIGVCTAGLTVEPGESCTYRGTDQEFSAYSSGQAHFLGKTYGPGTVRFSTSTNINGRLFTLSASSQGNSASWQIVRVGS